jgi:hypothetical protein
MTIRNDEAVGYSRPQIIRGSGARPRTLMRGAPADFLSHRRVNGYWMDFWHAWECDTTATLGEWTKQAINGVAATSTFQRSTGLTGVGGSIGNLSLGGTVAANEGVQIVRTPGMGTHLHRGSAAQTNQSAGPVVVTGGWAFQRSNASSTTLTGFYHCNATTALLDASSQPNVGANAVSDGVYVFSPPTVAAATLYLYKAGVAISTSTITLLQPGSNAYNQIDVVHTYTEPYPGDTAILGVMTGSTQVYVNRTLVLDYAGVPDYPGIGTIGKVLGFAVTSTSTAVRAIGIDYCYAASERYNTVIL